MMDEATSRNGAAGQMPGGELREGINGGSPAALKTQPGWLPAPLWGHSPVKSREDPATDGASSFSRKESGLNTLPGPGLYR